MSPLPGDIIFCHRKGFASWCIRTGERIRFRSGSRWSHVAFVVDENTVVEALTHGVVRTPLVAFKFIDHIVAPSNLKGEDLAQAIAFAQSCVGQEYGFVADAACALHFLTPGRGLWFGMNGTEMCSGLTAQCLVRGWYNFKTNPASLSPAELAEELHVQSHS